MTNRTESNIRRYFIAVAIVGIALAISVAMRPLIATIPSVLLFAGVVLAAWFARLGPALVAAALGSFALDYYLIDPRFEFDMTPLGYTRAAIFGLLAALAAYLGEHRRRSERREQRSSELLNVTLSSIGDAVMATDDRGRITFINPVAASLTGWSVADAIGRPLADVFRIVDEQTRVSVSSPFDTVMSTGAVVALANHTILLTRDGREIAVEDSGAPIRNDNGEIIGVVLVFRDAGDRRRAERERERLLEAERHARAEAELTRQRFEYLSMASAVLASSLDFETTLASAVRMAVPRLADWATIDMVVDGEIRRLAVAHIDPAKVEWAWELYRRFPPDPAAPTGVPNVIRTGEPEFIPAVTMEMIRAATDDPELLEIIERIGFTSAMTVPLHVRGRTVGAVSFVTAESQRRFDESDLALAQDLARRASVAIENADLYREIALQRRSLDVTIASIGDGVIATDAEGRIVLMNRIAEQLTGYQSADAIGRPLGDVFTVLLEATREPVDSPVAIVLRERTIIEVGNGTLLVDRNGRELPIDDSAAPILDERGAITGVVMTFRDVTERRRVERETRRQRDLLDAILGGVTDGITAVDTSGTIIFANDAAAIATGFDSADQMLRSNPAEILERFDVFDEAGERLSPELLPSQLAYSGQRSLRTVQFATRGSDARRWSTIDSTPVLNESGDVQFVINIYHDITERVLTDRQLRMRAAQQTAVATLGQRALAGRSISTLIDDVVRTVAQTLEIEMVKILELQPDGRVLLVRSGVGFHEGVVGHAMVDAAPETQAGYTLARRHSVIVRDLKSEQRFVGAPLLHEHAIVSGITVTIGVGDDIYGILGAHARERRDFTEDDAHFLESVASVLASSIRRERAEQLLQSQREWLRVTLASIGDAVIATDVDARITFMNDVAAQLTGWTQEEAIGRRLDEVFMIVNETTRAQAPNPALEALAHGLVVGLANHSVLIGRDGSEIPIDDSAAPIRNSEGEVQGVVLVFHDVSDRRRTEAQLRLSESRFRLLIEQSPLSIQVFSPDGYCIQANEAWEALWQTRREQLSGYNILEDRQLESKGMLDIIRRAFAGEPQSTVPIRYDPAEIGRTGRPRWVRSVVYPVVDDAGSTREVVLVLEDVTQRVLAEQRLRIQFDVARALAVAPTIDEAAREVLATVGSQLGASFGALWIVDRAHDTLFAADVWSASGSPAAAFAEETRALRLRKGEGLPGKIWEESRAVYVDDLPSSHRYPRQSTAHELGLGAGYGFPILLGLEVYGVLEFFSTSGAEAGSEVIETMDTVGRQVAQYVERRRAEEALRESEERYRTVAETASDAILIVDDHSRILFANRAVETTFGYTNVELVGAELTVLMPEFLRDAHRRAMARYVETGERRIDWNGVQLPGRHRDGRTIPLEISYGEFIKNGRHFFTGIVRDITDRKEAERELERAKEQAEAASAAKDRFLAVLSHELRTPLTPVLTLVQYLESGAQPVEDPRAIYTMIRRNIELEARLIDDLLDLTRITRGKLHLDVELVDAHALLRNVVDICREEVASKQQLLMLSLRAGRHYVLADPARLQQVFWNLLQNAVKFTPEHGRISVSSTNPDEGTIEFDVTDTGIGLESGQVDRVFNAFEQAERSISRRFGGLGLGLSISKTIVEMHGGTIDVASAGPNQGATFTVRLEAAGADATPAASQLPSAEAGHNGSTRRILLVDDHADTSNVMKLLLERRGYEVETAWDVASALGLARSREYDLLISDIGLPDGSGLDLMRTIREFKPLAGIALSGFGMEDDIRRSREAGFSEHLIKPVNFQALQEAIMRVIG